MFKYSPSTGGFYHADIHDVMPDDVVDVTDEEHSALMLEQEQGKRITFSNGAVVAVDPPPPTDAEIQAGLVSAVQQHLDDVARTRNYDGILSLCTYATSSVEQFAAEGQAGIAWRDAVWEYCYQVLDDVQAGHRNIPTSQNLILELPTINW